MHLDPGVQLLLEGSHFFAQPADLEFRHPNPLDHGRSSAQLEPWRDRCIGSRLDRTRSVRGGSRRVVEKRWVIALGGHLLCHRAWHQAELEHLEVFGQDRVFSDGHVGGARVERVRVKLRETWHDLDPRAARDQLLQGSQAIVLALYHAKERMVLRTREHGLELCHERGLGCVFLVSSWHPLHNHTLPLQICGLLSREWCRCGAGEDQVRYGASELL
mmetsp:Transcript_5595/g.16488  ORF Transcript_5595/g.16488 Transcript_5595/m.16488 type:complete len:217 (-) Transcript_5595:1179-1829(-)